MKTWTCKSFTGYWPTGTAAVMVAETKEQAAELLEKELEGMMLMQKIDREKVFELETFAPKCVILVDGEY